MFFASFFFSSRRRHTRWPRDWSSDVCSSDLLILDPLIADEEDAAETSAEPLDRFDSDPIEMEDDFVRRRSEERRVGKECRSGGAAEHEKKSGRRARGMWEEADREREEKERKK